MSKFEELAGKTITLIDGLVEGSGEVYFHTSDGCVYKMYHDQDCCEYVYVNDVIGDVQDIIGSPILMAEEVSDTNEGPLDEYDSYTWTFYKLATIKGYVTIRWYGSSNGYYSETVDFDEVGKEQECEQ